MTFVLDKLYVGGIDEASKPWKLQEFGLTHILTVDVKPLPIENRQGFEYKYVHAFDMEDFDMLDKLQGCLDFIGKGREEGGVLVHCHAGQSRSAMVVLAYLMQKMELSLGDAMTLLKTLRPGVRPNPGFLSQLELFELMGNRVDPNSQQYKLYKLSRMAADIQIGHSESLLQGDLAADPSQGVSVNEKYYRCKKCRRGLFKHSSLLPHSEGSGEAAFDWRSHSVPGTLGEGGVCERSYFIEPVQWMAQDVLQIEGKLSCPKCSAKIGSFKWTGEKCPCGTWVTPAFHIQTSKVDPVTQRTVSQPARPHTLRQPVVKPSRAFLLPDEMQKEINSQEGNKLQAVGDNRDNKRENTEEISGQGVSHAQAVVDNREIRRDNIAEISSQRASNLQAVDVNIGNSGESKICEKDRNRVKNQMDLPLVSRLDEAVSIQSSNVDLPLL